MKLLKFFGLPRKLKFRRVVGDSMWPTLKPGQLIVLSDVYTSVYTPKVGEIVMVRHDGLEKIKRISQMKDDKIYLLGDNPSSSTDSRDFGWLDSDVIRATLLCSL